VWEVCRSDDEDEAALHNGGGSLVALSFVLAAAQSGAANPVSFHLWTFILQAINVLVVLGGLYVLLFRPLGAIMAKREEYVENTLSNAASARTEAERLLAEYQARMKSVEEEAQTLLDNAARAAEEYERKRKSEADAEYEQMIAKAKIEIEAERQKALAAIRDEVGTLVVLAAGRLIGRVINEEDHRELVRDFVTKVSESR
jgi:F-type H+-transporting ATPase subunit b